MNGEFLRGQIYLPLNKLEFGALDNSRRARNSSFERKLRNKSSDNLVFLRILFTKVNYIIFRNRPVLGYAGFDRHSYCIPCPLSIGLVYTDAVSFVNVSLSMRLRLPFTRRRSRPLLKPSRFENAVKSGAFWKRYGFSYRVNGETASI